MSGPSLDAYANRREKAWAEQGIKFHSEPLTYVLFRKVVRLQGYQCGFCGRLEDYSMKPLAADHDHKTGEFRGAVDGECNRKIIGVGESGRQFRGARAHLNVHIRAYLDNPPVRRLAAQIAAPD